MIIAKFGGTSVSTKERLRTICEIVQKEKNRQPIVVVSAVRGVTDLLLSSITVSVQERKKILLQIETRHNELVEAYWGHPLPEIQVYIKQCLHEIEQLFAKKERDKAFADMIVSFGERLSSFIVSKALQDLSISTQQVMSTELIVTDDNFGAAEFLPEPTRKKTKQTLAPLLKKGVVPVVTGFIGSTEDGQITTLGRGGSDYTAAVLGYALHAEEIQIWTDVDGIFTSDPRFIQEAKVLPRVSYREASELAAFGAKVLHPRTIRPAVEHNIPVRVLNTLRPEIQGTFIEEKSSETAHVAAIASMKKIMLVNLYSTEMLLSKGFLARVFAIFAKHNISVNLVSVSEVSVSVSLDNDENLRAAITELETFTEVSTSHQYGMVSLIGEKIVSVKDIMKHIFSLLTNLDIPVKMISLGATDINISLVIASAQVDEAVAVLHKELVLKRGGIV